MKERKALSMDDGCQPLTLIDLLLGTRLRTGPITQPTSQATLKIRETILSHLSFLEIQTLRRISPHFLILRSQQPEEWKRISMTFIMPPPYLLLRPAFQRSLREFHHLDKEILERRRKEGVNDDEEEEEEEERSDLTDERKDNFDNIPDEVEVKGEKGFHLLQGKARDKRRRRRKGRGGEASYNVKSHLHYGNKLHLYIGLLPLVNRVPLSFQSRNLKVETSNLSLQLCLYENTMREEHEEEEEEQDQQKSKDRLKMNPPQKQKYQFVSSQNLLMDSLEGGGEVGFPSSFLAQASILSNSWNFPTINLEEEELIKEEIQRDIIYLARLGHLQALWTLECLQRRDERGRGWGVREEEFGKELFKSCLGQRVGCQARICWYLLRYNYPVDPTHDLPEPNPSSGGRLGLLETAARAGNVDLVEYLVSDQRFDSSRNEWQALRLAAGHNHPSCLKALLSVEGSDPSAQENEALRMACARGFVKIVKLLLFHKKGVKVNPRARDGECLIQAARNGHFLVVLLLLQDGRVDIRDGNYGCLQGASTDGRREISEHLVSCLLRRRKEVNSSKAKEGQLPLLPDKVPVPKLSIPEFCLQFACKVDDLATLNLLLFEESDEDAPDHLTIKKMDLNAALKISISSGSLSCTQRLLREEKRVDLKEFFKAPGGIRLRKRLQDDMKKVMLLE